MDTIDAIERMQKAIEDEDDSSSDVWAVSVSGVDLAHVIQENIRMRTKIDELQSTGSALVAERQDLRAAIVDLYEDCEHTYRGGYADGREIEIFRHGMKTVCNVVDAMVIRKIGRGVK